MSLLMIVPVSDRRELPLAEVARVWLLTSVRPHVHNEVASLVELALASLAWEDSLGFLLDALVTNLLVAWVANVLAFAPQLRYVRRDT